MRNFLAWEGDYVVFEGVLFADGTTIVHSMPPANMSIVHASLDHALASMDHLRVEWLGSQWFPTAVGA